MPDAILAKLECVDTLDATVARLFADPLLSSDQATLACPPQGPSLAKSMAQHKLALKRHIPGGPVPLALCDEIVNTFGPIQYYISAMLRSLLSQFRIDEIEALFARFGHTRGLLVNVNVARFLAAHGIEFSEEVHRRLRKIGVQTWLPTEAAKEAKAAREAKAAKEA